MTAQVPSRVVCFGELLLRLDTTGGNRLVQAEELTARYTGAEANVAVLLSCLGMRSSVVSRVPAHDLGQACLNQLRRYGVDTTHVLRGGDRLGLLYVEPGMGARATRVLYDRSHSSFAEIDPSEIDWAGALEGAGWLHLSGTAGAQGERVVCALRDGLERARSLGLSTSLDCNYRAGLWSRERMREVLGGILPAIGLFVGSFGDAELFCADDAGPRAPAEPREAARIWGERLRDRYGIQAAGFTVRDQTAAGTSSLTGYLWSEAGLAASAPFQTAVLDRIGSGDAFTAGIIFGLLRGDAPEKVVARATRAAGLKLTIPGDFALLSLEEIDGPDPGQAGGVRR